ncbi:MAG: hypothetical protein OXC11_00750 [Rhodospirillales bacterium]|nr:hypothetical protein [Rhodospirillales bacterium]
MDKYELTYVSPVFPGQECDAANAEDAKDHFLKMIFENNLDLEVEVEKVG